MSTIMMDRPTRVPALRHAEFLAARRHGLARQLSVVLGRLESLRQDIRKIRIEVDVGKREVTPELLAKVSRLGVLEQKLFADQIRIERKIKAAV